MNKPKNKSIQIVKQFFAIFIAIVVLVVVMDIIVRIYLVIKMKDMAYLKFQPIIKKPQYLTPDIIGYGTYSKFKPGMYKRETGIEYTVNSKGFRTVEFNDRKEPGVIRVFCFGGSSTMGLESADDKTYPHYLQGYLNQKAKTKKFEVLNMGMSSYDTAQIYNLFKEEIINYEPDVITVCEAFNDSNRAKSLVFAKTDLSLQLYNHLYYRWMLYTILIEKLSIIKNRNPIPFLHERYISSEPYVKSLQALISLAKQKHIKVILIKQPSDFNRRINAYAQMDSRIKTNVKIDFAKETIESLRQRMLNSPSLKEKSAYAYWVFVKEMERVAYENGILVVDPLSEFEKNKEKYFIDEVHLTPEGNKKIAEIIADSFLKVHALK